MKAYEVRAQAREALKGKWGKGALIILAYLAFSFALGFIAGIFGEDSLVYDLIEIATTIIQVPISFGLVNAFVKLKRNEEVKSFDFLSLGFSNFKRAWGIGLSVVLKIIVPFIGLILGMVLIVGAIVSATASSVLGGSAEPSIGLILVGLILFLVSYIWMILKSLYYSLTTFIAIDNPNMSSSEVVNESRRMMEGNRWKIFVLSLSFIGWIILTVCTFGIGYFWVLPYMQIASICFYESLLGKNENDISDNNNNDAIVEM